MWIKLRRNYSSNSSPSLEWCLVTGGIVAIQVKTCGDWPNNTKTPSDVRCKDLGYSLNSLLDETNGPRHGSNGEYNLLMHENQCTPHYSFVLITKSVAVKKNLSASTKNLSILRAENKYKMRIGIKAEFYQQKMLFVSKFDRLVW